MLTFEPATMFADMVVVVPETAVVIPLPPLMVMALPPPPLPDAEIVSWLLDVLNVMLAPAEMLSWLAPTAPDAMSMIRVPPLVVTSIDPYEVTSSTTVAVLKNPWLATMTPLVDWLSPLSDCGRMDASVILALGPVSHAKSPSRYTGTSPLLGVWDPDLTLSLEGGTSSRSRLI